MSLEYRAVKVPFFSLAPSYLLIPVKLGPYDDRIDTTTPIIAMDPKEFYAKVESMRAALNKPILEERDGQLVEVEK